MKQPFFLSTAPEENGYKIANPTVLGRLTEADLTQLFTGYGYKPYFVEGHEPESMHQLMAHTLDTIIDDNPRHPE